jgi:DNA repair protein RecO (recombination protein O)
LLHETMALLDQEDQLDLIVRRFELRLLDELGYRPSLEACSVCSSRLEAVQNYWSSLAGGAVCGGCADDAIRLLPLSVNALKVLRLLNRAAFAEVARIRLSPDLAGEIEACLRDHVHVALEREVRSARFVETLRRSATLAYRPDAATSASPPAL